MNRVLVFRRRQQMPKRKSHRDPREIPMYSAAQAARWVGVPVTTLTKWLYGREYPAGGTTKHSPRLIIPADEDNQRLSFANLAEIHILDATRKLRIPMEDVRAGIDRVLRDSPSAHPLLTGRFLTHGRRLFVEEISGRIVSTSKPIDGQPVLDDILDWYLERIQRDDSKLPVRLFPMRNNEHQKVMLDVNIAGGQPVIAGTGILIEFLKDLRVAGMTEAEIAQQYGLPKATVVEAIEYLAA